MGRSRSRSRSRERRHARSSSCERRQDKERSRSQERRRNDRRRSPDRRERSPRRGSPRHGYEQRPRRSRSRSPRRGSPHRGYEQRPRGSRSRSPRREERQREQRPVPAAGGLGERRAPGPCFKCGEEGHMARECPNAPAVGPPGGGRGPCFKCGQEGHIARDCPNPEVAGGGAGHGRRRRQGDEGDEAQMAWGKPGEQDEEEAVPDKEPEPEFGLSGALAAETNRVNGVVLLHQEPPDAAKPTARWRLYVFKGGKPLDDPLHVHRLSSYLFGRERRVADIPTDHPSCSKQHAVLQFRMTEKEGKDGLMKAAVRPYLMDLGSTNGTFVNQQRLEDARYYELHEQDLIRFGNSTREYVLIKEK